MIAMMKMTTSTVRATMLGLTVASGLCPEVDVSRLALGEAVMVEVIVEVWDTNMVVATVYSVVHCVV